MYIKLEEIHIRKFEKLENVKDGSSRDDLRCLLSISSNNFLQPADNNLLMLVLMLTYAIQPHVVLDSI